MFSRSASVWYTELSQLTKYYTNFKILLDNESSFLKINFTMISTDVVSINQQNKLKYIAIGGR